MKTIAFVVVSMFLMSGLAFAKAPYKTELGLKACTDCHVAGKFKEANTSNALYKTAAEHSANMKAGKGDFAGKTSCKDCHKGQQKPAK